MNFMDDSQGARDQAMYTQMKKDKVTTLVALGSSDIAANVMIKHAGGRLRP